MKEKIIIIKDESFKLVQEENADDILDKKNLENPIESCKSTFRDKDFPKITHRKCSWTGKTGQSEIEQPKILKTCKICEKSYESSKDFRRHISSVHEKIKHFPCPIVSCKSTFHYMTSQRLHMEAVHECKKPYQCPECGLKFSFKSALNSHIKCVHEEKKPQEGLLCDLWLKVKGQVKVHVNRVHKQLNTSLSMYDMWERFQQKSSIEDTHSSSS